MLEFYEKNKTKINELLYIILLLCGVYIFFRYIFNYIAPFVFAYVLSFIFHPMSIFLTKKLKISKSLSSALCCVVSIALMIFLSKTILSRIFLEAKYFISNLPFYVKQLDTKLETIRIKYSQFLNLVPQSIRENIFIYIQNFLIKCVNKFFSASTVKSIPTLFFNSIITMIATFFFTRDKNLIENFFIKIIPNKILHTLSKIKQGCIHGLSAYLKSELIMMCVTGAICVIGFCIAGYPYALFLGLITAIVDALPVLGTGFIIWPLTVYSLLNETYIRAIILIITYFAAMITRHILSPKLIGEQIGVHPLAMLFAIYIGLKFLGILGMILGPITIVIIRLISGEKFYSLRRSTSRKSTQE